MKYFFVICGFLILSFNASGQVLSAPPPPKCPLDFQPFHYKYSVEQLEAMYSEGQMERAAKELKEIRAINDSGKWKPTWESLDKHRAPDWYLNAKFGIMINWGVYSVPAWGKHSNGAMYPDAYADNMYSDPETIAHHAKYWGSDFQYDDFIPLFKASKYDPEAMIKLIKSAGARYIVPMCKHHDGFAWWNSAWTKRNAVQMGPKGDLLTPLVRAARTSNLKVVLYFTYEDYAHPVIGKDGKLYVDIWNAGKADGLHPLTPENRRRISGYIPVNNYHTQYILPIVKEMIDKFHPDGLSMDGEWLTPTKILHSRELVAYFYNEAVGHKEVFVNDRFGEGTRQKHGDTYTNEYDVPAAKSYTHPWEEDRGIGHAFAYDYEENDSSMETPSQLVHLLINVVSSNGNLVLLCGPDSSGVFPESTKIGLTAMGAWLKINGEGIYATRIFLPYHEGSVCFTRSKDSNYVYAICKKWPGKRLTLQGVGAKKGSKIKMLGVKSPLKWQQHGDKLTITIPDALQNENTRPCKYAWVIRIPVNL